MVEAKQLVLTLVISHGLLKPPCGTDIHTNLVATAHSFWEWTTGIMSWLLHHLSFHLALIPAD